MFSRRYSVIGCELLAVLALLVLLGRFSNAQAPVKESPMYWQRIDQALNKGLPKTAIAEIEKALPQRIGEQDSDAVVRLLAARARIQGEIDGRGAENSIVLLQNELENAPAQVQPMLRVILANWFWSYYQQNQWRFRGRTEIGETEATIQAGEDLKTWTRGQITRKAGSLFLEALQDAEQLKGIPIERFADVLQSGSAPESHRPTLYDFIVAEAVDHFADAESTYAGPVDRFELKTDSPVFDSTDSFLQWRVPDADAKSPLRQAIVLLQDWLRFHLEDEQPDARLDVDLFRYGFAREHAQGANTTLRETEAMRRFASENDEHPLSAIAHARLAQIAMDDGELVDARTIALATIARLPESTGAKQCQHIVNQIESPSLQLHTERLWNAELGSHAAPEIEMEYKNLEQVHLSLVPVTIGDLLKNYGDSNRVWHDRNVDWPSIKPLRQWTVDLPSTDDFKSRGFSTSAPTDLPKGCYFLIASNTKDFTKNKEFLAFAEVCLTGLTMVTRTNSATGQVDGYLLNAETGEPISGGEIESWIVQPIKGQRNQTSLTQAATLRTDALGRFSLPRRKSANMRLLAKVDDDRLLSKAMFGVRPRQSNSRTSQRSYFFTDRAIYRPGQTVRYKVVCTSFNTTSNQYKTLANENVVLDFIDANRKTIASREHRTNALGSCHGSFNIPSSGLTGQMRLRIRNGPSGGTSFRVEQYKRPKFEVELDQPEGQVRLAQNVKLTGKATAYTGAPIDSAKVKYRVLREVQYPSWWWWRCWWMPPNPTPPQVIVEDETTTNEMGAFEINFDAIPDESVDREGEPIFTYRVTADVIDSTGETRSDALSVKVGYTTLSASIQIDDAEYLTNSKPIEITVNTRTLQGQPVASEVNLSIVALTPPENIPRKSLSYRYRGVPRQGADDAPEVSADPNSWPEGETVQQSTLETVGDGQATWSVKLNGGHYRAKLTAVDSAGNTIQAFAPVQVLSPDSEKCSLSVASLTAVSPQVLQPGDVFEAVWGSGYESARALIEIEHRGKTLQKFWTPEGVTQVVIRQPVNESLRGGFILRTTMVRENRLYVEQRNVSVPWTNKELSIRWERFVSKLKPGQPETYTATISAKDNPDLALKQAAEMVATLYDESLDVFARHDFMKSFSVFYRDRSMMQTRGENQWVSLQTLHWPSPVTSHSPSLSYPRWRDELLLRSAMPVAAPMMMRSRVAGGDIMADSMMVEESSAMMAFGASPEPQAKRGRSGEMTEDAGDEPPMDEGSQLDLSGVPPRRNLNETAFFFPDLIAGDDGTVKLEFTMPEALTRWRLLAFAHDSRLASAMLQDSVVTSKDLMVQPNPPRSLREGDEIELTVKVSNQSATVQSGVVALELSHAATSESVDTEMGNTSPRQDFSIPAGQSKTFSWRVSVPDGIGYLTYKAVASTGRLSDGEEGYLPVLSRRILVSESIALPIRGQESKTFELAKLKATANAQESSIDSQSLTVQMTSNPAWYTVMALPYLMEFPHECSEQSFNRLYANALSRHIAVSDPAIERVFELWRSQPVAAGRTTLDSPLQQHADLKSIALTETPWVLQSETESEARRNVGILFDQNRTASEIARLQEKLTQMQLTDGSWPWFPGGRSSSFTTLYITAGYGRLRHLGTDIDIAAAQRSLQHLDEWMKGIYDRIVAKNQTRDHLSSTIAFYLYGRSFFLKDQPITDQYRVAFDYWLQQAEKNWLNLGSRMSQAHLAIALKRIGRAATATEIMNSLRERSVTDEMGMHWNDDVAGWYWQNAATESQAMMIEAFDEVVSDQESVERCKEWLLRQKETNAWESTKATADAVYALLLRGTQLLADNTLVDVKVGNSDVPKDDVEAGTGFYQHRFSSNEINPEMAEIEVTKTTPGIAWGGVHWKYFQNVEDVTPHDGTPLEIRKQLYVVRSDGAKKILLPIANGFVEGQPLNVGDVVVSRLIVKTSRVMEFIHLKDARGSGTEPVNVLSGYRYEDGLGYYQSTQDAAEHYFLDSLPVGTFILESKCRVQLRGAYQSGLATIESMYAPQYNSHSESYRLEVK